MTSEAQMLSRMHGGHVRVLERIAAAQPLFHPSASPGEIRATLASRRTLAKWGAIDDEGVTALGLRLLAAATTDRSRHGRSV